MATCPRCDAEHFLCVNYCDECGFEGTYEDFDCEDPYKAKPKEEKAQPPPSINIDLSSKLNTKLRSNYALEILMEMEDEKIMDIWKDIQEKGIFTRSPVPELDPQVWQQIVQNEVQLRGLIQYCPQTIREHPSSM